MKTVSKDGTAVVFVEVPTSMKAALFEHAQTNERTISAEVRIALRRHLAGEPSTAQAVDARVTG